jgi:hypothetical protein
LSLGRVVSVLVGTLADPTKDAAFWALVGRATVPAVTESISDCGL